MKRILTVGLVVLLLVMTLCPVAEAYTYTLSTGDNMIVSGGSATMYAYSDPKDDTILCYVPAGETVMYLCAVDRGYFVVYGNCAGYVDEGCLIPTQYYSFELPNHYWDFDEETSYYEFPYTFGACAANQNLATRSGPSTGYTEPGTFPQSTPVKVAYQTEGNGVNWGYIEFLYNGKWYRVYTGMKRLDCYDYVPYVEEETFACEITCNSDTYYGPGTEYADCGYSVVRNEIVSGLYEEYGWLLCEFQVGGGLTHRGWVPAGCWQTY